MEVKKIILNGCSYTHGCDVTFEQNNIRPFTNFYEASKSWSPTQWEEFNSARLSGRLEHLFNCETVNLALAGFSNEYIASKTIDYIESNWESIDPSSTVVMIGWTEFCRTVIYTDNLGCLNYSLPYALEYLDVFSKEFPKNKQLENCTQFLLELRPLTNRYLKPDTLVSTTDYFRHINLMLMLQFYLQKKGLKYVFWNSLKNWPRMEFDKGQHPVLYSGIEDLVDWSSWEGLGTKESYERSWEELIRSNPKYMTGSCHPSAEGITLMANRLFRFVTDRY